MEADRRNAGDLTLQWEGRRASHDIVTVTQNARNSERLCLPQAQSGVTSSNNSFPPAPPRGAGPGFHQLVARKGGTRVGLGRGGARRGWVARPATTLFPFPLTHTHLSSQSPALPSLGLCLDVRGYCSRRFHVQSLHVFHDQMKLLQELIQRTRLARYTPEFTLTNTAVGAEVPVARFAPTFFSGPAPRVSLGNHLYSTARRFRQTYLGRAPSWKTFFIYKGAPVYRAVPQPAVCLLYVALARIHSEL